MATPDILITPSKGLIEFTGSNTGTISLRVAESGDLHFEGDQGSLLSISDDLSDSLFSIGDPAGMPVFEVFSDDTIRAYHLNEPKFEIDPENQQIRLRDNTYVSGDLYVSGAIVTSDGTSPDHISGLSGYFGKVGIGTTQNTTNSALTIHNQVGETAIEITEKDSTTRSAITMQANDSRGWMALRNATNSRVVFSAGGTSFVDEGAFLVGSTTADGALFSVDGDASITGELRVDDAVKIVADNGNQLYLDNDGDQWTQLNFANNGTNRTFLALDYTNHNFVLGAQGGYSSLGAITFRPDGSTDRVVMHRAGEVGFRNRVDVSGVFVCASTVDCTSLGVTTAVVHDGDSDTKITFDTDRIKLFGGGVELIDMREAGTNYVMIGGGDSDDVNFICKSQQAGIDFVLEVDAGSSTVGINCDPLDAKGSALVVSGDASITGELKAAGPIIATSTSRVQADVLNNGANSANIIYRSANFTIVGNHASGIVIQDDGSIGIGTAAPKYPFHWQSGTYRNVIFDKRVSPATASSSYTPCINIGRNDATSYLAIAYDSAGAEHAYITRNYVNARLMFMGGSAGADHHMHIDKQGKVYVGSLVTSMSAQINEALFTVSGDASISGELKVNGEVHIPDNLVHKGDTDTYLNFNADRIRLNAGGVELIDAREAGADYVAIGGVDDDPDVNLLVGSAAAGIDYVLEVDAGTSTVGINCDPLDAKGSALVVSGDVSVTGSLRTSEYVQTDRVYFTSWSSSLITNTSSILGLYGDAGISIRTYDGGWKERVGISDGGDVAIYGPNLTVSGDTSMTGSLHIGSAAFADAANDLSNPVLAIKQAGLSAEQGIYLERGGERKGYYIGIAGVDGLHFQRNFAGTKDDVMCLTRAGDIGIGTANPDSLLHINTSSTSAGTDNFALRLQNPNTAADARVGIAFSTNAETSTNWDGAVIQATNNGIDGKGHITFGSVENNSFTENLRITSSGFVGIGTASPQYVLDVTGSNVHVARFKGTSQSTTNVIIGDDTSTDVTLAHLQIRAANDDGSSYDAAKITIDGYEGRAKGIYFEDQDYSNMFFAGVPYQGYMHTYQIGYGAGSATAAVGVGAILTARYDANVSADGANGRVLIGGDNRGEWRGSVLTVSGDASISGALSIQYPGGAPNGIRVKGTANRAKIVVSDNDTSAYMIAEDALASFGRQDHLDPANINISNGGNVGIGTTNPERKVEIRSSARSTTFAPSNGATWHDLLVRNPDNTQNAAVGLAFEMNATYHANGAAGIAAVKEHASSDYAAGLAFVTRPNGAVAEERFRITNSGNVGIGTTNPNAYDWNAASKVLEVFQNDSNGSALKLRSSSTNTVFAAGNAHLQMGNISSHPVKFYTAGTQRMTLMADGNLGIGTSIAEADLHVNGEASISGELRIERYISHGGDTDTFLDFSTDRILTYAGNTVMIDAREAGTDYVAIGGVGDNPDVNLLVGSAVNGIDYTLEVDAGSSTVGINCDPLDAKGAALVVSGDASITGELTVGAKTKISYTNPALDLQQAGTTIFRTELDGANDVYQTVYGAGNKLFIRTNSSVKALTIDGDQNVGIGTSSPTQKLVVYQGKIGVTDAYNIGDIAGHNGMMLGYHGGDGITWQSASNDRMYLDANGKLGVGISLPSGRLHVENNGTGIIVANDQVTGNVLEVFGSQGNLLTVTDDLSDSLFSVGDAAGMPVFEVFSDDTVRAYHMNQAKFEINPENQQIRLRDNVDVSGNLTVSGLLEVEGSGQMNNLAIKCTSSYRAANIGEVNNASLAFRISQTRQGQTKALAMGSIGSSNADVGIQAYDSSDSSNEPLAINPFGGHVGIGTATPSGVLHILDPTDGGASLSTAIRLGRRNGNHTNEFELKTLHDGSDEVDAITFCFNDHESLRFNDATAASKAVIDIGSNNLNLDLIRVTSNSAGPNSNNYYGGSIKYMGERTGEDNSLSIWMHQDSAEAETEVVSITQRGKVLIGDGTATRAGALLVVSGNASITGELAATDKILLGTSSTNHVRDIDFRRTSTSASATARIRVIEPAATHTSAMTFSTSDADGGVNLAEVMRIDQNGHVGMGTATPSSRLHVVGDVQVEGTISGHLGTHAYARYGHMETAGGDGGSATADSYTDKEVSHALHLEQTGCAYSGFSSFNSANYIMTLNKGQYYVRWTCPGWNVGYHHTRLRDADVSTTYLVGTTAKNNSSSYSTNSDGAGTIYLERETNLKMQHFCTKGAQTYNFGYSIDTDGSVSASDYDDDIYWWIEFWKVSSDGVEP